MILDKKYNFENYVNTHCFGKDCITDAHMTMLEIVVKTRKACQL